MWPGTVTWQYRPEGGFVAAVGRDGRAHVVVFAPRATEWLGLDSQRDHAMASVHFARHRPPFEVAAAHVLGQRIGFAGPRGFAVLAETTDASGVRTARLVALRRGARAVRG